MNPKLDVEGKKRGGMAKAIKRNKATQNFVFNSLVLMYSCVWWTYWTPHEQFYLTIVKNSEKNVNWSV